jgi:hypothetical protein
MLLRRWGDCWTLVGRSIARTHCRSAVATTRDLVKGGNANRSWAACVWLARQEKETRWLVLLVKVHVAWSWSACVWLARQEEETRWLVLLVEVLIAWSWAACVWLARREDETRWMLQFVEVLIAWSWAAGVRLARQEEKTGWRVLLVGVLLLDARQLACGWRGKRKTTTLRCRVEIWAQLGDSNFIAVV